MTAKEITIVTVITTIISTGVGSFTSWKKSNIDEAELKMKTEQHNYQIRKDSRAAYQQMDRIFAEFKRYLQEQYSKADTLEEMEKLASTLGWMIDTWPRDARDSLHNSPEMKELAQKLRTVVLKDLDRSTEGENGGQEAPGQGQSTEAAPGVEAPPPAGPAPSEGENAKAQAQAKNVTIEANLKAAREQKGETVILESIECVDPQSNWPKSCDEIQILLDEALIWPSRDTAICRGQTREIELEIPCGKNSVLKLIELDKGNDNDFLGKFNVLKVLKESQGRVIISSSNFKGEWTYMLTLRRP